MGERIGGARGGDIPGACGNHATVIAPESVNIKVDVRVGAKTESCLPTDKDKLIENDLKGSQSGELSVKINGKEAVKVEDLSEFKDQIKKPGDIKIMVQSASSEPPSAFDCPAGLSKTEFIDCFAEKQRELVQWEKMALAQVEAAASAAEKHKIVVYEIAPLISDGEKDINTMSPEEIERFTDAMTDASKKAGGALAGALASLTGGFGLVGNKMKFWKNILPHGKFKVTTSPIGTKLIHFYNTPALNTILKKEIAAAMAGANNLEEAYDKAKKTGKAVRDAYPNPGTRYKMDSGLKNLPGLGKTKFSYIERYFHVSAAAKGTVIGVLLVTGAETGKWYMENDPEKQWSDLFVMWGMAGVKAAIQGGLSVAAGIGTAVLISGTALAGSVILIVGGAVVFGVFVAFALEYIDSYFGITDSMIQYVRKIMEYDESDPDYIRALKHRECMQDCHQ